MGMGTLGMYGIDLLHLPLMHASIYPHLEVDNGMHVHNMYLVFLLECKLSVLMYVRCLMKNDPRLELVYFIKMKF